MYWQHKKAKTARYSAKDLKNLRILPENSSEGLGSPGESTGESTETKLDDVFPLSVFHIDHFSTPYRLDRNRNGGGIIIYIH